MAAGNNSFYIWTDFFGFGVGEARGAFTYDPTAATMLTVNEGLPSTSHDDYLDAPFDYTLMLEVQPYPNKTNDQTVVGGAYNGMEVGTTVGFANLSRTEGGGRIGRIYQIAVDKNGDGRPGGPEGFIGAAFDSDEVIGYTIVLNSGVTLTAGEELFANGFNTTDGSGPPLVRYDQALGVACFTRGTKINAISGAVAIEDIDCGDLILTQDRGYQPVRWIGSRKISAEDLSVDKKLYPIRIKAGALGSNSPSEDLLVSPQHRVLVSSKIVSRMFGGEAEVLVAAKQLTSVDGIDVAYDVENIEYFHLMFEQHEVIFSNGAKTESLFTGPEALKSVGPEALSEILKLFPELESADFKAEPCRTIAKGRLGRKLAVRHQNNMIRLQDA